MEPIERSGTLLALALTLTKEDNAAIIVTTEDKEDGRLCYALLVRHKTAIGIPEAERSDCVQVLLDFDPDRRQCDHAKTYPACGCDDDTWYSWTHEIDAADGFPSFVDQEGGDEDAPEGSIDLLHYAQGWECYGGTRDYFRRFSAADCQETIKRVEVINAAGRVATHE